MSGAPAPSGEQFEIASGDQRATIVEVGGGVRRYDHGGRAVLEPYRLADMCDGGHGAVLAPWPNRLADGRYELDGAVQQLALSEPARGNAIHGLLRWVPWRALEHEPERVLMGARLHPQPGYPFDLRVTAEYALGEGGLTVVLGAENLGARACPFGIGQHPYLSPGEGTIDACSLQLPARTLVLSDERGLPCGSEPLAGGPLDFRASRTIGETRIDSPFCDLERSADGRATAVLAAPDGSRVELWVDEGFRVLEVFTGDTLAPQRRRTGLAVEPMTCPPDALRSGQDLLLIEPGGSVRAVWGARLAG